MNNTSRPSDRSKQKRSEATAADASSTNDSSRKAPQSSENARFGKEGAPLSSENARYGNEGVPLSSLQSWSARYERFQTEPPDYELKSGMRYARKLCNDYWSGRDVTLSAVESADGSAFADNVCSLLLSRAKILQACDHTHVVALSDYYLDDRSRFFWVTESRSRKNVWQRLPKLRLDSAATIEIISQFVSIVLWFEMQAPHTVPPIQPECLNLEDDGTLWLDDYQFEYLFDIAGCQPFPLIADFIDRLVSATDVGKKKAELVEIAKKLRMKPVPKEVNSLNKLKAALRHIAERSLLAELSEEVR